MHKLNYLVLAGTHPMIAQMQQAKPAGNIPPPPPPPAPAAPAFTFDTDMDIPAARAFGGKRDGNPSVEAQKIAAMPLPNADGKRASFIVPVTVPADITGDARVEAFKKATKTIANRIGGIIRRHRKAGNASANFAVRVVSDDKLGYGVRVWREADTAA